MITDTREKIISYITGHGQARVHDLVRVFGFSHMAIHKQVRKLVSDGVLQKAGKPPLVFYTISAKTEANLDEENIAKSISERDRVIIDNNFLHITPEGRLLYGVEGFIFWQKLYQSKKNLAALAEEYLRTIDEKQKLYSSGGWIDATEKARSTFREQGVDRLFYADIYSIPVFGRTKLAKLVMHAKQSENREIVEKICLSVKPIIERVISEFKIRAVGFIPPTVPRPVQFVEELAIKLALPLPHINLVKAIPGDIPVPQKTLARLDERIINARSTIFIKSIERSKFGNILLIDDVAGSGASFHETAKKIRAVGTGNGSIIAFALVGNMKGFDVIKQM